MSAHALVYALLIGIVPSFIWLFFWLREDVVCPEPKSLIAKSFLAGALSVIVAIFAEKYISDVIYDDNIKYTFWAAIEEIVKFITVAVVALRSKWNDEPVDAMIYIITVALGFAAIENTLFILGPMSDGAIAQGIMIGSMRFVGATLVHVVSSALIGFTIGLAFYRKTITKILSTVLGLGAAIVLHASFNLTIINTSATDIVKTFMWIWAGVVILIILFEEVKAIQPKLL
jgi:RsiW-degrading membrane proteinase PrsW (M82 family)